MNTDRDAESVSRDPLQGDVMKLPGNALPALKHDREYHHCVHFDHGFHHCVQFDHGYHHYWCPEHEYNHLVHVDHGYHHY